MKNKSRDLISLYLECQYLDEGLENHRLALTDKLVGKRLEFDFDEDGESSKILIDFKNQSQLEWGKIGAPLKVEQYEAIELRSDIFFVDWVCHQDAKQSISVVIDFVSWEATLLRSDLPNQQKVIPCIHERIRTDNDLSAVKVHITHAGINGKTTPKVHHRTKELIGKRLVHNYGNHTYEHIYLNEELFTWHCLAGEGEGTADTEPSEYFKIGEALYLFIWREKIHPWIGIILIDLSQKRTAGKVFYGDIVDPDRVINYTVGAQVEFWNETKQVKKVSE